MQKVFLFFILAFFALGTSLAQNDSKYISQTVPEEILAGEEFNISITFENTGTSTWTDEELYHLGSQNPQDNFTWGVNRLFLSQDVFAGEQYTFTATLTAPENIGMCLRFVHFLIQRLLIAYLDIMGIVQQKKAKMN